MFIELDVMVWRIFLSVCIVYKNKEIGEFVVNNLLELEFEDLVIYVFILNMYVVNKNLIYRDEVRKMMNERGVKKEFGFSWIEVKNLIYFFFCW